MLAKGTHSPGEEADPGVGFPPWCCNTGRPCAACPQTALADLCAASADSGGLLSHSWLQAHLVCGEGSTAGIALYGGMFQSPHLADVFKPTHNAIPVSF